MRAAGIDCGTNSVRLLLVEADTPGAPIRELTRQLRLVRLGEGVDATGEFSAAALQRTFGALDEYAALIREAGIDPEHVRMVATSAARDVRNRGAFTAGVRARLGITPDIITGAEEAALSFAGALGGLHAIGTELAGPVLVSDVGGGSTEFAVGDPDGRLRQTASLDIGSVRLRERSMPGDPPSADELAATREIVDAALDSSGIDFAGVREWIGVAGTVTSLMAAHLDLPAYDRDRVHGVRMSLAELQGLADRFCSSTVTELRTIPSLHPQRAEVISAGAVILERISRRLDVAAVLVSETDILDGVAESALRGAARHSGTAT